MMRSIVLRVECGYFYMDCVVSFAMKILFVNHTFPPESYAGSELCVLGLAQRLRKLGHAPVVFYRHANPDEEEYAIQKGEFQSIPIWKINHTYKYAETFQDIYFNPAIAIKFGYALREIQPDIVHFHHLTNLSLSMVNEVKMYGCPSVMTLHDYWLLCQRGQLLKSDLSLCQGPGDRACRACLSPQLLRGKARRAAALIQRLGGRRSLAVDENSQSLLDLKGAEISTPHREYIQPCEFVIENAASQALMMHPPAEASFPFPAPDGALLKTAIAMHPSTYSQAGGGVRFEVWRNQDCVFFKELNPKQFPEHQNWHEVEIQLEPSIGPQGRISLKTIAMNGAQNEYCAAGWREPTIQFPRAGSGHSKSGQAKAGQNKIGQTKPLQRSMIRTLAERASGWVAHCSPEAYEGIEHRKNWAKKVLDDIDLFISPSKFLREFFIRHGLPERKVIFSDNGFPPVDESFKKDQSTTKDRSQKSPRPAPVCFGYIGTWIPSKGVDLAVQAFQGIDPLKARLIIHGFFPGYAGYENYEVELRSQASPAVEFRGKYDPGDVQDLLREIDCLIMPSIWWENSPMTIHEAFQAEVPVITADVGGMAEQVAQGGGLTFRHRDAGHLREIIAALIAQPERLDELRGSIPHVKTIDFHAEEMLSHYSRLCSTRGAE